jgi:hypothetical protein
LSLLHQCIVASLSCSSSLQNQLKCDFQLPKSTSTTNIDSTNK